jgi:penicillin amidase
LIKQLQTISGEDEAQQAALSLLIDWNGDMNADSAAPALFVSWAAKLRHQLLDDELNLSWNKRNAATVLSGYIDKLSLDKLNSLISNQPRWCDKINTGEQETCGQLMLSALADALDEIGKYEDGDLQQVRWDGLLKAHYRHTPFSEYKLLDGIFAREVPGTGATDTLNVANATFGGAKGYLQNFGASFRHVVAFDNDDIHYFYMNSTGQSGNPLSDHFDDMLAPFNQVQLHHLQSSPVNQPRENAKP